MPRDRISHLGRRWRRPRSASERTGRRDRHVLRLAAPPASEAPPRFEPATAITSPTDPRWVLALRVADQLEGIILPQQKRARLLRLGKTMGLSAFDSNLIIAIIQDRARQGHLPIDCPTAACSQLAMIGHPSKRASDRLRRAVAMACAVTALIAIEILTILLLV